ncbi:YjfB family protein [Brenneria rubrifaciens]|uniref:Putative motility protein n=1 Tax=Brenneria rubrifaciens TaxID=55213 RepID=A0A4P8QKR7_9GAMM|nr:YjfB family protein [Brenneria rubrifaciens]QCR07662.1 putative motility protein [Brenneria rubrifaciens]
MDVSQIASLATSLSDMQTHNEVGTLVLKKTLDNQAAVATSLLQALPPLPANPAIGRNINTTA